ncbi:tachylectin-related carbohydrate-binding protein [Amycolatopsis sp. NPDC101161]|uniref:tachylectin-related carbohydrate-binding protein n=1 Tax=Amycolatopsis sp. NPDC101161 TaxID=3363940 RepID=UPI00382CE4BF
MLRKPFPRRPAALFCAVTATVATVSVAGASPAAAADTITCRASAGVFYTLPDTHLDLDRHNEPETGATSWTGRTTIGFTWSGKTLAGPDGRMYTVADNGDVTRQRRLATGWENGGVGQKIATGWNGVTLASQRNRITVDATGDFYWTHDNILAWVRYDETTKVWTDRLIDTGWTQTKYDLIVGAGAGVFYARTPAGALYRFQYDPVSQRWIEYATLVGTNGWQNFSQVASAGGDVLYALDKNNGQIKWYRYLGAGSWTGPKVVGTIGTDYQLSVTTDDCKLINPGLPSRPSVPTRPSPATFLAEGAEGKIQHFYVDDFGRLIHGRQRTDDVTIVEFAVVPGYQEFSDVPSAVRTADNSLLVAALGQDSETRTSNQAAGTTSWPALTGFGGWTPGPARVVVRDGVSYAFAVDAGGKLWLRPQDPASKQFLPWRVLPSTGLSPDITVVTQTDGIDVFARTTAGLYTKATYTDGALSAWLTVPGTSWPSVAAAVANPDKNLQVFATQPDGVVATQRELSGGFTGTWKPLAGVTATGSPAAAMDPGGTIHVAVRANDGYVYVTEQVAPGSATYRDWQRLSDSRTGASYQSTTDPALVAHSTGGVVAAFRDADGVSYVYSSSVASGLAARTTDGSRSVFTGGPLPKPKF